MRAVTLHGPHDLRVAERADPEVPPSGLIIGMAYTGVCGSDVRNWRHGSARLTTAQVPGHEVVGVVRRSADDAYPVGTRVAICPGSPCGLCRACRAGAHNLCPDREVLGYDFPGGMEEEFALPQGSLRAGCVIPLPDRLELRSAVLAEPMHTVINGQDLARVGSGDSVLVLGLGTIGTLHAALARSRGAGPVLGVDPRGDRVTGAASVLGGDVEVLGDDHGALRSRSGDDGWSVVVVAAGARAAVDLAMEVVAPGGRILAFAGLPPADARVVIDVNRIHYRQIELIGAFGGTPATFARAVTWLADADLELSAIVTDEYTLDDVGDAYLNVEQGRGLKTVLRGPEATRSRL